MLKSKIVKVILIILAVILVAGAALFAWQYENIMAFIDGVNLDEEQINQKVELSHKAITDYIENNNMGTIRPMSEEETQAYINGEITKEDATKIMTGQLTLEEAKANNSQNTQENNNPEEQDVQSNPQDKPDTSKPETKPENKPENKPDTSKPQTKPENKPDTSKPQTKPENKPDTSKPQTKPENKPDTSQPQTKPENKPEQPKDYDTLISEKVAELYVIKANYYAEFNAYWASAKAEFLSRPVEEHTQANVAAVVRSRMSEGFAMEDRYDAQVDTVVSELTALLKEAGRDTSLASSVKNAYVSEKKAEKARIIAKYFG